MLSTVEQAKELSGKASEEITPSEIKILFVRLRNERHDVDTTITTTSRSTSG
jgi:hypothetical protein